MDGKVIFLTGTNCGYCKVFNPNWVAFIKEYKPKNVTFEVIEMNMETKEYDKQKFPTGLERYSGGGFPSILFWKTDGWRNDLPVPFVIDRGFFVHKNFKGFEAEINRLVKIPHKNYEAPKLSYKANVKETKENKESKDNQVCNSMISFVGVRK